MNITYNGDTPEDYGAWLANKPVITHSKIKRRTTDIPGHDGLLYSTEEYRGDAQIDILLHMKNSTWMKNIREVRRWISQVGILTTTETDDSFYEVVAVDLAEETRPADDYGRLKALMTIYPYEFLNSGNLAISNPETIQNDYDKCQPLYHIAGTGSGTLSIMKDQTTAGSLSFEVPSSSGHLYIDTRRMIATAMLHGITSVDSKVQGDYENFRLEHGLYSVEITSGFTLEVTPRWGYYV